MLLNHISFYFKKLSFKKALTLFLFLVIGVTLLNGSIRQLIWYDVEIECSSETENGDLEEEKFLFAEDVSQMTFIVGTVITIGVKHGNENTNSIHSIEVPPPEYLA